MELQMQLRDSFHVCFTFSDLKCSGSLEELSHVYSSYSVKQFSRLPGITSSVTVRRKLKLKTLNQPPVSFGQKS